MNRMVNASATNPSATWLSGRTPNSCGCRKPRLYNCVATVDVLTWRSVSSTPSGSGSSCGSIVMLPHFLDCSRDRGGRGREKLLMRRWARVRAVSARLIGGELLAGDLLAGLVEQSAAGPTARAPLADSGQTDQA